MNENDANDPGAEPGTGPGDAAAIPRRVWGGTSLLVLGRLWGALCTMAILALLSRHLAPEDFGRFTFWLAVFALLDALADFGTGATAVQRSANDPWAMSAVLLAGRRIRVAMGSLGLALVCLGVIVFREPGGPWIALAALYPLTHALELSATVFKNKLSWGVPVAARAFAATARLGLVLVLWKMGIESAGLFVLGSAAGSATANLLLHRASRPHLPRPTIPIRPEAGLLRAAAPLGVAGLCQQAYFHVDNLFVRGFVGLDELGVYNAGVRLMSVGIMVAQFAPQVALPWLVRRHGSGGLGEAAARLGQPLFAAACVAAGALWPWCDEILRLLFGEAFAAGGDSLRWLLLAGAAVYAGACLLTAVVASGNGRAVLVVAVAGLLTNTVGNLILVPLHGIDGAAQATFATEAVVTLGALAALVRGGARPLGWRAPLWLAGPAAGALAWLLSSAIAGA